MNIRQKVGLGIITPLFVFAVGHTAINKINQQKQAEREYLDFHHNIDLAISKMSMAKDAEFKAKLNMDSTKDAEFKATLNMDSTKVSDTMAKAKEILDALHNSEFAKQYERDHQNFVNNILNQH